MRLGRARGQNKISNSYSQFGLRGRAPRGVTGELSPASVYVSFLPVVECPVPLTVRGIVVAVPERVREVRFPARQEAVDLDPGVLACRLDAPATVKAVLEQGRVLRRNISCEVNTRLRVFSIELVRYYPNLFAKTRQAGAKMCEECAKSN